MKTKVKTYRKAQHLTQEQLAQAVLVTARTIISIEKEQYSPSLMLAYRMARVFDTTVEDLCEGGEANCPTRRSFLPHSVLKLTPLG
ncbi:helix-turn-helix transcriptional regulator, partial [Lacticaseibacillus daqingensis]|uniref:helix-turn-helix transcriptional regulator n=1 Tax=Lacticaseibacillus daqingensis TaxID=2486014 RepID=UPI0013DD9157